MGIGEGKVLGKGAPTMASCFGKDANSFSRFKPFLTAASIVFRLAIYQFLNLRDSLPLNLICDNSSILTIME